VTDRERRLMRALVRIAAAVEALRVAAPEALAVRHDLAEVIERNGRSLRWEAAQPVPVTWRRSRRKAPSRSPGAP
jgi:hypothetical protein